MKRYVPNTYGGARSRIDEVLDAPVFIYGFHRFIPILRAQPRGSWIGGSNRLLRHHAANVGRSVDVHAECAAGPKDKGGRKNENKFTFQGIDLLSEDL